MKHFLSIISIALFFSCSNCNEKNNELTIPDDNYRYFRILSTDDNNYFLVRTSNEQLLNEIDNQLLLPINQRNLHINGKISERNNNYNSNWSWNFIDDEWSLTPISIELCDASPIFIENNLDYFIETLKGIYCPWNSKVDREMFAGDLIENYN